jgi:DNA polymerase-3 subunit alpha
MTRADFVPLHVHSHYSLLDGACRIEELVAAAAEQGIPALALTDSGNLFGAVEFYKKAKEHGIKPIIGCEVYVTDQPHTIKERSNAAHDLVLLCRNPTGYANLIELVSVGYLEGFYHRPRVDGALLARHAKGLIALSGGIFGKVGQLLLKGKFDAAAGAVLEYRELFDGQFYLEVMDHGLDEEKLLKTQIVRLAETTGVPLVATNNSFYIKQSDSLAREVLFCIATGRTLADENRKKSPSDQYYFKSPQEMRQLFSDVPGAYENTLKVAEQANLQMDFTTIHLPRFTVPGGATEDAYLEALCREALPRRYPGAATDPDLAREVNERLESELSVIRKMGFPSYFLIVWDFIRFARGEGIPVGPGRGSAAGSLVSYLLGITNLCPIRFGLFFERFLNPGRASMPDIDIDFCERNRHRVIEYVQHKYGAANVCQIITFGMMKCKAALKDVARVLGLSFAEANRITKAVPEQLNITLTEALASSAELRRTADAHPQLFEIAARLEGVARHSSTHAAGVVITPDTLYKYCPLYKRDDEVVTQYTMKWLEAVGILKMDFLGLSTLTVIQLAIDNIRKARSLELAIDRIPLDDKRTFRLLAAGETQGVFTFETSQFKDLLRRLKPTSFDDLVAAQALGRPGPLQSGMVDEYIAAKHGARAIHYPHPSLKDILRETQGVFIYQEQVMQCANVMAGYTLAEADGLRKAMGKKIPAEMEKQRERFVSGAIAADIEGKIAEEIFALMEKFAAYGFNKSHSACYALVSYQTAFLKANFPAEFMAACITIEMGNTDKLAVLIEECDRLKIEVLPPDIHESEIDFTVVGKRIRFGLGAIRNLGTSVAESILAARRRHGTFGSLPEFCKAVDLRTANRRAIESLIKCGAFDRFPENRAQLLAVVDQAIQLGADTQKHQAAGQGTLLDFFSRQNVTFDTALLTYPEIPNFSQRDLLNFEKETLGLYISGHPLAQHERLIESIVTATTQSLPEAREERAFLIAGLVKALRKLRVKSTGKNMAILTIEDLAGTLEIPIFNEIYEKHADLLVEDTLLVVHGRVAARRDGEMRPVVDGVALLESVMTSRHWRASVSLECPEAAIHRDEVPRVKNVLLAHRGRHSVYWKVRTEGGRVVVLKLGKTYRVTPDRDMIDSLEEILGRGAVSVRLVPPAGAGAGPAQGEGEGEGAGAGEAEVAGEGATGAAGRSL